ncbi:MAG: DUF2061 domain-containing protein [Gammaproteobacteria bacterium]|jgi:uncharacterized membrane protein
MTKTMSFAVVHFTVAFSVAYVLSGNVLIGGAIALVEPAINTVAYHFHEQVWDRLNNRRRELSQYPRQAQSQL